MPANLLTNVYESRMREIRLTIRKAILPPVLVLAGVYSVMIASTAIAGSPQEAGPAKGAVRDIGQDTWVLVAQDISNASGTFEFNGKDNTCLLLPGGQVQVIGIDKHFGVLVRYTLPPGMNSVGGLPCPTGTLTFMSAADVSALPSVGKETKRMRDEAAAVQRLTGN